MIRFLRLFILVFAGVISVPFLAILVYQIAAIAPNVQVFSQLVDSANPEDKEPPITIRELIKVSHQSPSSPTMHVSRLLMVQYSTYRERGTLSRIFESAAWLIWTEFYFSEDEIMSIFCTLSYNGEGQGVNALSTSRFGKPLSQLSVDESAEIVAILRGPSYVTKSQARLDSTKAMLLGRLNQKRI